SGARAIAIDLAGNVLVAATEEYPLATPRPGWTEQEPEDWWAASQAVLRRVVSECGQPPLALGLTGQMHGAVFLDESDHVIRPARCSSTCAVVRCRRRSWMRWRFRAIGCL